MRLERNHTQGYVAKLLNINQMYLSSWELNQKKPHPKHLENIIEYLGYLPEINVEYERLGMVTKLYRLKHQLSLEKFCQMANVDIDMVFKWEHARYCKVHNHQRSQAIFK
ncbi:MAG: helix-turn-helix transcriptional regulator [Flavobacteriaceae bacterium]|nr:helix-turn-helix transcriptional regulator [Flavobacteriaceae bacterium]